MNTNRTAVLVAVVSLLAAVVAVPGMVAAADTLDVSVTQSAETGAATVTVTQSDAAVENATVVVDSEGSYAGNGTYATDETGTVTLPNPDEPVTVTVTATSDGEQSVVETELVPHDESLAIDVEQDDDTATVTVTQYGEAVENATLVVEASDNGTYADAGEYATDENGTVELGVPENRTQVDLTVTHDGLDASRTVTLGERELELDVEQDDGVTVTVARDDAAVENATLVVEASDNETYDGEGDYTTDENGTVDLPVPDEPVTVTVTATADGDTVSETVTLENETETEYRTFGGELSAYVHQLLSGASGGIGDQVSEFAHENNPSSDDEDADDDADDDGDDERDSPEQRGPPEHANDDKHEKDDKHENGQAADDGDDDDDDSDDSDDDDSDDSDDDDSDDSDDDDSDDDDDGGPPEHARNN